ncbi:nucleotide sugar dehydrogenase [Paraclostridium sordellii]|uniref:nucleotide sugar dehydrogenase n=1 Tax=Paraclostridium sordellii TaxID=1505 RepID=UPI0005DDCA6B|nr:nucleotide sugar dehydrogenase [Paeniclostridium sordellii]CEN94055.1 protein CapL [[Clostridium] sordellii] [Paeniclostridium sordellii]CEN96058.1 protein CapL [[Clostridium] sordellii] [Paeniclostridium sordellii]
MSIYESVKNKHKKISVIGLGYVGIPLAVEFAKEVNVIGYDINKSKINEYLEGIDSTQEVGSEALKNTTVEFTYEESRLREASFHIIAVPTPINSDKTPNLNPVISATEAVARNITKGSIVVYESTVYPGTTEEICIPILEKVSGLKHGKDFKVGYSPERINPGDKKNKLRTIIKIVSGSDKEALEEIANIYGLIIDAGVYKAESIKVAEAAKVIENSQRDINIAFMNELAMVFNKMDIDTSEVLRAAGTKWNFLNFTPGLVGGHCIGVDPYYFIYKAEELGYHSQIILSGRKINDGMSKFIAENTIKTLIKAEKQIKGARVAIMGLTFKENCPDIRNTKVMDIINELHEYGVETLVYDPLANKQEAWNEYKINIVDFKEIKNVDAVIFAVAHDNFKEIKINKILNMYSHGKKVIVDVKGLYNLEEINIDNLIYWKL